MKYAHVMLDLETLSLRSNALILSAGFYRFSSNAELEIEDKLEVIFSAPRQRWLLNRHVDKSTIKWWKNQQQEARVVIQASMGSLKPVKASLDVIDHWFNQHEKEGVKTIVWGNGAKFDNAVLSSLYENVGRKVPWSYKADMCYRTIRALRKQCIDWDAFNQKINVFTFFYIFYLL